MSDETGTRQLRCELDENMWAVLEEVGRMLHVSPKVAHHLLMVSMMEGLQAGQHGFLPITWLNAWKNLQRKGLVAQLEGLTPIDITKLHRSDKMKTGFVGVYVNGHGFAARGTHPTSKSMLHLGTYPTAEEAAWARYLHHQKHGLAYGRLGTDIEEARTQSTLVGSSDAEIRAILIHEAWKRGEPYEGLTPEEEQNQSVHPQDAALHAATARMIAERDREMGITKPRTGRSSPEAIKQRLAEVKAEFAARLKAGR